MTESSNKLSQKKAHQLELRLLSALSQPDDGDQRRRYLKRFIYGDTQGKEPQKIGSDELRGIYTHDI